MTILISGNPFVCVQAELVFMRRKWDEVQLELQEQEKQLVESYKTRIKVIPLYMFNVADTTRKFEENDLLYQHPSMY
jgi:hypothetical protein